MKLSKNKYKELVAIIGSTLQHARQNAIRAINAELIAANWQIGRYIVEFEQEGKEKAEYGSALIASLARDLKLSFGKGFSRSSLQLMRQFYLMYPDFYIHKNDIRIRQTVSGKSAKSLKVHGKSPIRQTVSGKSQLLETVSGISKLSKPILLSWSHYAELLTISDDLARSFYEQQAINENWSLREMKRQIDSSLFERLALSKNKRGVLALAKKGNQVKTAKDVIRDPYIFEFLEFEKDVILKERGLEKKLIDNLQKFLLELGKGFSFVARQFKITIDNEHHFIDLVFYHRILKCFVLIDLKTKKVKHQDIGQMNLYLNYYQEEENTETDNPPIGIIVAADKHDYLVKYATGGMANKIFVSKYQLYLPDKKLLEQKIKEIVESD